MRFNPTAARNLARILEATHASLVLTTTHRIRYSVRAWADLFAARGIHPASIAKVNDLTELSTIPDRATEVAEWVAKYGQQEAYIVIDDDLSLNGLPLSIRSRCVLTKPLLGLSDEATENVLALARDFLW